MKIKITKEQFNEMMKCPNIEYTIGIIKDEEMATKKCNAYGIPVVYQGSYVLISFEPFDEDDVFDSQMHYEEALDWCKREYKIDICHIFYCPEKKWRTPDMYDTERGYFTANELWADLNTLNFITSYSEPKIREIYR